MHENEDRPMTAPSPCCRLKVETLGGETVVRFTDHEVLLDEQTTQSLREQLFSLLEGLGPCRLVVDLSNVRFLSSTTLGLFLSLQKKLHAVGGGLVLWNIGAEIREIFAVTQLDK